MISIDWKEYEIFVPKSDLSLISLGAGSFYDLYEYDVDVFRLQLKDLEDNEDGMPFPKTHNHNTELTLGGITYARAVEILDPYTITFENGEYGVSLVGANSNIVDRVNVNSVSVRPNNSAGLIVKTIISGSGLSVEQNTQLMKTLTLAKFLGLK